MMTVLNLSLENIAVFSDLDLTVLDRSDEPDKTIVPESLVDDFYALHEKLRGAFAIISGRDIGFIDEKFGTLPASASHGMVLRKEMNKELVVLKTDFDPQDFQNRLLSLNDDPNIKKIEIKDYAVAVHHHANPDAIEKTLSALVEEYNTCASDHVDTILLGQGHDVFEIGPAKATKGSAMKTFMDMDANRGRKPLFLCDQPLDESGVQIARQFGGFAIGIGKAAPKDCALFFAEPVHARDFISRLNTLEITA